MGDWSSSGLWNQHKCLCGLLQENENFYVLTKSRRPSTFFNLQHSSTTSLTVSHLHVSPSISPWPTLALILKRPRGSTTTSSRTCEAQQKQKMNKNYRFMTSQNMECVHLSKVSMSVILMDIFASPNYHDMQHVSMCTANLGCWWLHIWQFLSRLHLRVNGQWFIIQHDNWQHTATYLHKLTMNYCMILSNQNHETIQHDCHPLSSLSWNGLWLNRWRRWKGWSFWLRPNVLLKNRRPSQRRIVTLWSIEMYWGSYEELQSTKQ